MTNTGAILWTGIIALGVATTAWAQGVPPDAFQIRYAANLNIGDSVVNISNAGTLDGSHPAGNICVNVYAFAPDETMVSCCACRVTPDGLASLSAVTDLISNTLTPALPNSIIVKLLATEPVSGSCNASLPTSPNLAPGMRAWGTTLHANTSTSPTSYLVTETDFAKATLSDSELMSLTDTCAFIQDNGAGYGICRSCRLGGL